MSRPRPTTQLAPFPTFTKADQDEMEPALIALASKSGGDLRKLLYAFFSFLNRRTDFYLIPNELDTKEGISPRMGFKEGDAEKLLLAAFRQFPLRRMPRRAPSSSAAKFTAKTTSTQKSQVSSSPTEKDTQKTEQTKPKSEETRKETNESITITTKSEAEAEAVAAAAAKHIEPDQIKIRTTEEGKQIPVGNGGIAKRYQWTQTLEETTVILKVPAGTRGKDLNVSIKPTSVSIRFKKQDANSTSTPATPASASPATPASAALLEGELFEKVRTEESTWSLEGSALLLTLEKYKQTWWETVIKGDEIIDTTMVDSTRKIGSYDEATQGYIRKIMFDQQQERLGKPTSQEILFDKKFRDSLPAGAEFIDEEKMKEIRQKDSKKP